MKRGLFASMLVMAGCDILTPAEAPYCENTATVVGLDEATALGFSAQQLLDLALGQHDEVFTYADGTESGLSLEVSHAGGEARFVTSEAVYPKSGSTIDIGIECFDRVEVDVSISLATDDGALAESWDGALTSSSGEIVDFSQELDPDALSGSLDFDAFTSEPEYDDQSMWTYGSFTEAGALGEVNGQVSGEDRDSAWAALVEIGAWDGTGAGE